MYFGYIIGEGILKLVIEKLKVVEDVLRFSIKKEVRFFLGLFGYYRKFVLNFVIVVVLLNDLMKKGIFNKFEWKLECENVFRILKFRLFFSFIFRFLDLLKLFILRIDVFNYGVGVVLM